jgi:hypothetical protein
MSLSGSRIRIITCITQIWLLMLVPSVKTIFAETLSNEAQISILTVDSGKEIWTVFGHTAIRIHDPINNIDEVYNYGTFDFDQNRFYLKFLRGNLIYYLSRDSFDHFLKTYKNQRGEKVTDTQWHNIVIWGGLADVAEKYLKKGKQIAIEGRLETNAYDDNEGKRRFFTQVNVNDLVMLGKESN